MSLDVFLHPSTTTPDGRGFTAAVEAALASMGAVRATDGEGVELADGSGFLLFLDGQDDIALLTLDSFSPAIAEAVYTLAAATHSFLVIHGSAWRLLETGGIIPSLALGFPHVAALEDRAKFAELLDAAINSDDEDEGDWTEADQLAFDRDVEAAALATAPPEGFDADVSDTSTAIAIVSKPRTPLLRRLSDALFGKAI